MAYKRFLKEHSIKEISKKTHISPISLGFMFDGKFEKIDRRKFFAFIKIIEKEYNVDLSDLKDDFNENSLPNEEELSHFDETSFETVDKSSNKQSYFFVFILVIGIVAILYYMKQNSSKENIIVKSKNITVIEPNNTEPIFLELNKTENDIEVNDTEKIEEKNSSEYLSYRVEPVLKLWCKIRFLDDNSTKEYLTSNPFEVNASREQYIKCGHGEFTIIFGDKNLTPNTKKIVRYLFKDNNFTKVEKIEAYE